MANSWGLYSFNVIPHDSSTTAVFGTDPNGSIIVMDGSDNLYWPAASLDEIGYEHTSQGYEIMTTVPDTLKVPGISVNIANTSIPLSANNWSLIAYLPQTDDVIEHALASLGSSLCLVEDYMDNLYWPAADLDEIGIMHAGQGYWVLMNESASLTYRTPENGVSKRVAGNSKQMLHLPKPIHYAVHASTGNSAVLLAKRVTIGGQQVPDSSEIGAFDASGNLVGSGTVMHGLAAFAICGQSQNIQLQNTKSASLSKKLFGGKKNGCTQSESITFKLWTGKQEYSLGFQSEDGSLPQYSIGKKLIGYLNASGEAQITKFDLSRAYPNPFKGSVKIAFDVPSIAGVSQQSVEIGIYNLNGSLVKQLASGKYNAGHYELAWNSAEEHEGALGSSVYIVRMKATNFEKRLKLVRVQ